MILAAAALTFTACSEDSLDSNSIFDNKSSVVENEFDKWLQKNYVEPYNIEFKYRFEYKESDPKYNLAPADYDKSIALAKLTKYLWLEAYDELLGKDFLRTYAPKILNLVGSVAYNSNGGVVLGTAEGGMKIVLYNVNSLNPDKLNMDFLNEWFFNTMHHEFAHILHQTKNYPTDFNEISKADYQSDSWVNLSDEEALAMGFVNNYASSETQEDFVQTIAFYITKSDEEWAELLEQAIVVVTDENGDPVYELDSKGNYIYEKDADGNYIPAVDKNGNPIYVTDENGDIVYEKDKDGNYILELDEEGNPIPVIGADGKPVKKLDDFGNPVYDVDFETGQVYYVYEYEKVPMIEYQRAYLKDYSGYNKLEQKLAMVKDYLKANWNIDLDKLHQIVQRRQAAVAAGELDLKSLN
jgi:substrate import-associated zinc metallohydrolase lipoprotein